MQALEAADRRKYPRFKVQDGAFAILWPNFTKLGQIDDIGANGLAFSYIAGEDISMESSELDILTNDNAFYLEKMPCDTVYDIEVVNESPLFPMKMRRLGMRFGELTQKQSSQLDYFISNYTLNEA